jgi:DNA-binding CsgD family transcriptional regulator
MLSPSNYPSQLHTERLEEIIYLMSHEKTSQEIADILCLSKRTIEEYRLEIMRVTNSKNVAGVTRYAYQRGIADDLILKARVEKYLDKKK